MKGTMATEDSSPLGEASATTPTATASANDDGLFTTKEKLTDMDVKDGGEGGKGGRGGEDGDLNPDASSIPPNTGTMEFPKKLLAKIDRRLLISMFFLNFISLMGRTNIGATLIRSMPMDLSLDAQKVFIVLVMPTAPLILFEVPSNLLMRVMERRFDFSYIHYMCLLDFLLGIVTIGQGFVTSFGQLCLTRFLVGVFDAGLIPACVFVCAIYYPGAHLQWRLGIIQVANISSNIVGNFLAYAIAKIDNNDLDGWRWIFIIEGCFTIAVSGLCAVVGVGPPAKATWLSEDEKATVARCVEARKSDVGAAREWRVFFENPLNYVWAALYCLTCSTTYSVSIFSPSFVQAFDPSLSIPDVQAQVVPIFVVSSAACLATAWLADRLDNRAGFALAGYVLTIVGYAVLRVDDRANPRVTMMALYFVGLGTFVSLPMIWNLTMQNLATPFQRDIGSGFVVGIGNTAGYISAWIFRTSEGPWYRAGMTTGLIMTCVAFGLLSAACVFIRWHNARLDRKQGLAGASDSVLANEAMASGKVFRYKA